MAIVAKIGFERGITMRRNRVTYPAPSSKANSSNSADNLCIAFFSIIMLYGANNIGTTSSDKLFIRPVPLTIISVEIIPPVKRKESTTIYINSLEPGACFFDSR